MIDSDDTHWEHSYEREVAHKIKRFERKIKQSPPSFLRWSTDIQKKIDRWIPGQVHRSIANALEKGIKTFLEEVPLQQSEKIIASRNKYVHLQDYAPEAIQLIEDYKKLATIEGAGTGFGGIIASTIDFPALVSIKLRLMQELANLYGYDLTQIEERVFVLKVIQLQFSEKNVRWNVWQELQDWELEGLSESKLSKHDFDWEEFYLEYKRSIELPKLLQIIPGLGAIVGAWANHSFLEELGQTAMLCYEQRKLQEKYT